MAVLAKRRASKKPGDSPTTRGARSAPPRKNDDPPTLSRRLLRLAAILAVVLGAPTVRAETYRVGPGRTYKNLQAVARILNPGDLVEVDGNVTYPGGVTFTRPGTAADPIVIRGLLVDGKRPVISGGTNTVHFRTDVIGSGADHYVMEGFEITGGSSRCVFHQSNELTLRDVVVHDCPSYGIKGADWGAGSLTVERSEVFRCGAGDSEHQIDASTDQANYPDSVFRLQDSYLHDANGGNNVKSRAARNEIQSTTVSKGRITRSSSSSAPSAAPSAPATIRPCVQRR